MKKTNKKQMKIFDLTYKFIVQLIYCLLQHN